MIESFKHKGLKELFDTGRSSKVPQDMKKRIIARLDVIRAARTLADLNQPGYNFHQLTPSSLRWTMKVTGAWRITFLWQDGKAIDVDLEQYH
jgi:toxin HigB-1